VEAGADSVRIAFIVDRRSALIEEFRLRIGLESKWCRFVRQGPKMDQVFPYDGMDDDTDKWQLNLLFELGLIAWLIHAGVVCLAAMALFYGNPQAVWPAAWLAAMLALSAMLAILSRLYTARQPMSWERARRFGAAHTALTAMVGLNWGLGALGASHYSFEYLLVYSLALGGTALGAVSSQHTFLRSCFSSLWTSVPLLALAHLMHRFDPFGAVNAGMIVLYAAILSILTVRLHGFMQANVTLNRSLELARKTAVDANLAKSRFLAQASHDLRQPIHAIGLFTASLREEPLKPAQRRLVDNIDRSIASVSRLFRSLLDISLLDIGRVQVVPEPVALGEIIADVVRQNGEAAREARCEIAFVGTGLWAKVDPALLTNMLQNLLSNAIRYAPRSRILIGCRRRGRRLAIVVADNGPGIADKHVDLIFEEFYRVPGPATQSVEGLGLGLPIVRRLGELMGLDVHVVTRPAGGTAVTIGGLVPAEPGESRRAHQPTHGHPLRGRRILLIDDDPTVLEATTALLEKWGCTVHPATGAPGEPSGCDTIICDFDLGGDMNGLQVIRAVRALEGRPVPAMILSGRSEAEALDAAEAAGIPYVAKPARPAELRGMLTDMAIAARSRKAAG